MGKNRENWRNQMSIISGDLDRLEPTYKEICVYVDILEKQNLTYGVVTYTRRSDNPLTIRLHDTYRVKYGGKLHIDVISGEIHLMLDRHEAPNFLAFVKGLRAESGKKNIHMP